MKRMHTAFALITAALLAFCILAARAARIEVTDAGSLLLGCAFICIALAPLATYALQRRWYRALDAAGTAIWSALLTCLLGFAVMATTRLSAVTPLQDARLASWDAALGMHVPAVQQWAAHHWLGLAANAAYPWLERFMLAAFFLPLLLGRARDAQRYVLANLVAFTVAIPLCTALPALGPWQGYGLHMDAGMQMCTTTYAALRAPGALVNPHAATICFPSFHVIWALLSAQALWGYKRTLRWPAGALAALTVLSTLTTGMHYGCDVLCGVAVAALAMAGAQWATQALLATSRRGQQPLALGQLEPMRGRREPDLAA